MSKGSFYGLIFAVAVSLALPAAWGEKADKGASHEPEILDRVTVLDGVENLPAEIDSRSFVVAIPGAGETQDKSLFLEFFADGNKMRKAGGVRAWMQQSELQPSQVAKQRRKVSWKKFERQPDGAIAGTVSLSIETPEQAGQKGVVETFDLELSLAPDAAMARPDLRVTRSQPPWRRLDYPLVGDFLVGDARGAATIKTGDAEAVQREVDVRAFGAWQPVSMPGGPWSGGGDAPVRITHDKESLQFEIGLAPFETDAGEGAWRHLMWTDRRDLSAMNALLVEYSAEGNPWGAFDVSLEESPGLWYAASKSLPVTDGKRRKVLVPFSGMSQAGFDMDHWFTPRAVGGIRIGATSGDGLGPLSLRIYKIEAVRAKGAGLGGESWPPAKPAEAALEVDFAALKSTNGTSAVPEGLFGIHGVGLPKDADALSDGALRELGVRSLRTITTSSFGEEPLDRSETDGLKRLLGEPAAANLVECWSPPLLSAMPWKDGIDPFQTRLATFAGRLAAARDPAAGVMRIEFLNEPFMWARQVNLAGSPLMDLEQHGYMPGPLVVDMYARLFNAAVNEARKTAKDSMANGTVLFGGPSSANFSADDWRHLLEFVLPVVARCSDRMQFITEHHYQGRGQQYAAEYEVLEAALAGSVRRRIPIWNTECNDLSDQPGAYESPLDFAPGGASRRRAAYQFAEILEHLRFGADHTQGRSIHALWNGAFRKKGEEEALRMLTALRGDLVRSEIKQPGRQLQAAASREGGRGSVVLYNDGPGEILVSIRAGELSPAACEVLEFDPATDVRRVVRALEQGDDGKWMLSLKPLESAVLRFENLPPVKSRVDEEIHYARTTERGALWQVAAGMSLPMEVAGPLPRDKSRKPVRIRVVAERVEPGEATLQLGKAKVSIPQTDLGPRLIEELPIPKNADWTRIKAIAAKGMGGFRICSLALVWETESKVQPDAAEKQ